MAKTNPASLSLADAKKLVVNAAVSESAYELAVAAFKNAVVEWSHYKALRSAFVAAKCQASGCSKEAAAKSWERLCNKCGYKAPKSDSEAAKAKREQRAKTAEAKPAKDNATEGRIVRPGSGKSSAAGVKMELIGIEAHIIDLFRRGQFKAIIDICHSEAEKQAPM